MVAQYDRPMTGAFPVDRVRLLAVVAMVGVVLGVCAGFDPENTLGVALSAFWAAVLLLVIRTLGRVVIADRWVARAALAAIVLRGPLAVAHLFVAYVALGGAVDLFAYFEAAQTLAQSMFLSKEEAVVPGFFELDFSRGIQGVGWDLIDRIYAVGYLAFGPSIGAMLFLCGLLGFFGSYMFLRAYQATFGLPREARLFAVLVFFSPSLAFWTGLLGKDSLMFLGLGLAAYGVANIAASFRLRYLVPLALGLAVILLIRQPTLLPVGGGAAVASVLSLRHRLWSRGPEVVLRPFGYAVVVAILIASASVVVTPLRGYITGAQLEDEGAKAGNLAEGLLAVAVHRHVGLATDETTSTRSSIAVSIKEPTLQSSLTYLPLGMFTFLFRPLIWEAHNAVALLAAVDGTLLMALVVWRRRSLWQSLRSFFAVPFAAFCWISFFLLTAGLAFETNFGAIVRHRAMVLAFFFVLLAFPDRPAPAPVEGEPRDAESAVPA